MARRLLKWWLMALVGVLYLLVMFYMAGEYHSQQENSSKRKIHTREEDPNEGFPPLEDALPIPESHIEDPDERAAQVQGPDGKINLVRGPLPRSGRKNIAKSSKAQSPFEVERLPSHVLLDPNFVPNTVMYVWCGKRWFEFPNYLSVKSVIRELRPDNIIFYYDVYPVLDYWLYNTWFDEIRREFPFFRLRKVEPTDNACNSFKTPNMTFIYDRLTYRGGLYINEHTILSGFPIRYRNFSVVNSLDPESGHGFLFTRPGLPERHDINSLLGKSSATFLTKSIACTNVSEYIKTKMKPPCVNINGVFFPKDIWELDNGFGRLARRVFYGNPEINLPKKSYQELIPNIAHLVWIGGGEMDYLFYLSVLSLIYVAEVEAVYIHGDGPPTGSYWHSIKDLEKIKLIYRETPKTVFGTEVNVISHVTDIWRVDFMLKYGGIYVDTDTIFVKPLDKDIRAYDAVGTYDWTYWNSPFPDTINYGVAIGKKNAKYWQLFQKSMDWFLDKDWSWNGLRQPYKIKERHPELALMNQHLQVICYKFRCHPTWWPDYHNESIHHLNSENVLDWRNDAYAFHLTLPTPPEFWNEENLLSASSMFGEIGRNVLEKAGRLKQNNK